MFHQQTHQTKALARSKSTLITRRLVHPIAAASTTTSMTLTIKEVAQNATSRPDAPRSAAAAATLPAGSPFSALLLGGYAEYPPAEGSKPFKPIRKPLNDCWGWDDQATKWTAITYAPGPVPEPRMASQAVVVGNYLYLIGGWNSSAAPDAQFLADVWRLDLTTWAWTQLHLQGEQLPPLSKFQAAAIGPLIFIYHSGSVDTILKLDVTKHDAPVLSKVAVHGDLPPTRSLHSLTAIPALNKLVLYGGSPEVKGPMLGDLYVFDVATNEWRQQTPSGPAPHARCSHTAVLLPDGVTVLFTGGAYYKNEVTGGGGLQVLNDVLCYNVVNNEWIVPEVAGGAQLPAARNAAVMLALPGAPGSSRVLLYGGWVPFVSTFNDTHELILS